MQPYMNQNAVYAESDTRDFHHKCKQHLYQIVQVELKDGSVYQGILHSYDREKMYILMSKMEHSHMPMHTAEESSDDRQFFGPFGLFGFPFFGVRRFGPFFPFFI
jgi:small nuclear ribonucleoprotein (snRNP)-like protein